MNRPGPSRRRIVTTVTLGMVALVGCASDPESLDVPTAEEVRAYYTYGGALDVEMSGNVAQLTAVIDRDQYLMGGSLWVRAAPYVFLFSPATRDAMTEHPGLGGVRVIVRYQDGSLVAQALLDRAAFNPRSWPRALNIAALARSEGSQSPGYMRDLVRWGEDHTVFEYNPDYVPDTP